MQPMDDMIEDDIRLRTKAQADETSTLANSHAKDERRSSLSSPFFHLHPKWYRLLPRARWAWQGADPIESERVLSRIAASDQARTCDSRLDTVVGYKPGNWQYEWSQLGAVYGYSAKQLLADQPEQALDEALQALTYYGIAAYPHMRGDLLAQEAMVQVRDYYQLACKLANIRLEKLSNGREHQGWLHLPPSQKRVPVVVVMAGPDLCALDFLTLYRRYLLPKGLGMLTVDMGGCSDHGAQLLAEQSDGNLQAMLATLKAHPWVDDRQITALGVRLGAQVLLRTAFMDDNAFKAVALIAPWCHQALVDRELLDEMPPMMRDCVASRLGVDGASPARLALALGKLSLARQGLMGRRRLAMPVLSLSIKDDPMVPPDDGALLKLSCPQAKIYRLGRARHFDMFDSLFGKAASWLEQI